MAQSAKQIAHGLCVPAVRDSGCRCRAQVSGDRLSPETRLARRELGILAPKALDHVERGEARAELVRRQAVTAAPIANERTLYEGGLPSCRDSQPKIEVLRQPA